jgi:hypothetical protein
MGMHIARNGSMTFLGKPPQAQRAYDKVKEACAAQGLANDKDVAYALGVLGTKARQANARAPKREKRKMDRKTLKAAGEIGKTKSDWMREADKWFSRFIRLRDTRENSNGPRSGRCVTCGDHRIMADLDCGHWIRREHWGTRYDEKNCHAQCSFKCNNLGGGKEREHQEAIEKIHGQGTSTIIRIRSEDYRRKPTAKEFQAIADKYEKKVSELGGWPDK